MAFELKRRQDAPILGATARRVRELVKLLEDEDVAECVSYCRATPGPKTPIPGMFAEGNLRDLIARLSVEL